MQSARNPKDYVCACSIGNETMPLAAVSLSRDGEVDFFVDILTDKMPLTWHFNHAQGIGVAYSLATAGGHLFILTSNGIYTCLDMVERFLRGELRAGVEMVTVRHLPLDVIDFALAYKTWMMVLLPDKIVRISLRDMIMTGRSIETTQSAEEATPVEASESEPLWGDIILPAAVRQLAVA